MERIKLNAHMREEKGTNRVKKIREKGQIPAVLYKMGELTKNIKVEKRSLHDVLHTKAGENVIIDLVIEDKMKKARPVMIKEIQYHPIKDTVLHVDFNEISLTKEIKVNVPIATKGEADAVTKEGGTVEHIMWEVEVECLPTNIPEKIEIDISELKIGDAIHIKDLTVGSGIKILNDPELTVISGEPPHVEAPAEEVPAEDAATEPEVITKGKKEEEGEGEAGAEPAKKDEKKE